jgi:SAM-dependent methyltransferase
VGNVQAARSITDLLFRWGRRADQDRVQAVQGRGRTHTSKAFARFLSYLTPREAPVLLDLGPVVGSNVSFFGDRLGCKLFVEDVFSDLDRFARENRPPGAFADSLRTRFRRDDASVDGILCWDLVDYLDRASAHVLGGELSRLLKPGGALLGFFATRPPAAAEPSSLTKFVVIDDQTLEHRPYQASCRRQPVLNNRDVNRLFDGLRVAEQFLLQTHTREILFRRPD